MALLNVISRILPLPASADGSGFRRLVRRRKITAVKARETADRVERLVADLNRSLEAGQGSLNRERRLEQLAQARDMLVRLSILSADCPDVRLRGVERLRRDLIRQTEDIRENGPENMAERIRTAEQLERLGYPDGAIAIYEGLVQGEADQAVPYMRLAILYRKAGKGNSERRILELALRNLSQRDTDAYRWLSKRLAGLDAAETRRKH